MNNDDIIGLPHWEPKNHVRMPLLNRAAQFSPFDPLDGYEESVAKAARETDEERYLDEESIGVINRRLAGTESGTEITVLFFEPDQKKTGGAYRTASGTVKKIDTYEQVLVLTTGEKIPLRQIMEIE